MEKTKLYYVNETKVEEQEKAYVENLLTITPFNRSASE